LITSTSSTVRFPAHGLTHDQIDGSDLVSIDGSRNRFRNPKKKGIGCHRQCVPHLGFATAVVADYQRESRRKREAAFFQATEVPQT
jgi:hypothetical protein